MGYVAKRVRRATDGTDQVRWRARWTDPVDGQERERQFVRRRDAQQYLLDMAVEARLMGRVEPGADRQTFAQWWDHWTAVRLWAPETERAAEAARAGVTFSEVMLRDLTRRHIETWIKTLTTATDALPDGLAPRTVQLRYGYIHRCLAAAVREGLIRLDPSANITLPRRPRGEAEMHLPTTEEVDRLIDSAPADFRAYVFVCAHAGLRRGEAAGLMLADLDRGLSAIHIRRQAQTTGSTVTFRQPKWGSARIVRVPADVLDILEDHIEHHGTLLTSEGSALFQNSRGGLLSTSAIAERWTVTRQAAGLPGIRLHDLRHYYASRLIAAGVDVVTVQHALGHASPEQTLRTYAHLWPQADSGKLTQEEGR